MITYKHPMFFYGIVHKIIISKSWATRDGKHHLFSATLGIQMNGKPIFIIAATSVALSCMKFAASIPFLIPVTQKFMT